MTDPIIRPELLGPAKPPGSPFHHTDPRAMSCIRCGQRNIPGERVHAPRYGRGQTVCKDTQACQSRRSPK